jgi:uncharacterized phage protein (TIGR01671 family)
MRDIKFRAWHIRNEKMYKVIALDFRGTVSVKDGDYNMVTAQDNVILEQYTGLKDKNGVEIYVGDLLEGLRQSKSKVVSVAGGFILKHADGSFDHVYESLSDEQNKAYVNQSCEVIGNIHESEV